MYDGRPVGIIQAARFSEIFDYIAILRTSGLWLPADQNALVRWQRQFLTWMITSENGKAEQAARMWKSRVGVCVFACVCVCVFLKMR